MSEQAYTVVSDSDTIGEEKSSAEEHPEVAIGIDIGTSQCSVAVWNGSQVEILKNPKGQKMMKSYVTFKDENPSSGVNSDLSHNYEMLSGAAIFNIKRLIGRVDSDPVVRASKTVPFLVQTLDIGVRPFIAALVNNLWRSTTAEEVLAIFLLELKTFAEVQLKKPVRSAVLTVPVCFSRFQLTRVERACAMAGLHVLRLMPEPSAVALLYAQQQQQPIHENMGSGTEKLALIFNLGAGFCDVAITSTAGGVSQIKSLSGSPIGGEDILQNMMHRLVPEIDTLFSSRGKTEIKAMALLRVATQDAMHKLSYQPSVQIDADLGNGMKIYKVFDREEFEEVNRQVFDKCGALVKQCLQDAKISGDYISDVILVGGCSNIPIIKKIVTELCNCSEVYTGIDPLEAAVRGAALEGAVASGLTDPFGCLDLLTIQATPLSIGVKTEGNKFVPVISQNTTMPARKEMTFTTAHDNQPEALVVVYEGNEKTAENNNLLGYFKITGIPLAPKGIPEISVCMDIDASNVLRVLAGVVVRGSQDPVAPFVEARMPIVDDGHGWCAEALHRTYGSDLDLATYQNEGDTFSI